MREFDYDCLIMAKIQGEIFEKSISKCGCSSSVFIKRYMNSLPARSMDNESFLLGSLSDEQALDMINEEYNKSYGSDKYASEELYWIGYTYRVWAYIYNQRSKDIIKICSPKQMQQLYYAYHSLDCVNAINRILEARNIDYNNNLFEITQSNIREQLKNRTV